MVRSLAPGPRLCRKTLTRKRPLPGSSQAKSTSCSLLKYTRWCSFMIVLTSPVTFSGVSPGCSVRTRSPWTRSIGGSPELRCRSEAPFSAASQSSASMVGIRLVPPALGAAPWCKTRARQRSGCVGLARRWSGARVTLSVQFRSGEGGFPPAEEQGGAARDADGHQRVDDAEDDGSHPRLAFPAHRERDHVDDHVRGVGVGHRQREATLLPDADGVDEQ